MQLRRSELLQGNIEEHANLFLLVKFKRTFKCIAPLNR